MKESPREEYVRLDWARGELGRRGERRQWLVAVSGAREQVRVLGGADWMGGDDLARWCEDRDTSTGWAVNGGYSDGILAAEIDTGLVPK